MEKEYFIRNVEKFEQDDGSYIIVVSANPVHYSGAGYRFITESSKFDIEDFIFADNQEVIAPILALARAHRTWKPNEWEFKLGRTGDGNDAYFHDSFYGQQLKPTGFWQRLKRIFKM